MWQAFVNYLVYDLIGLSPETKLGSALNFFIYDTVKILVMLSLIIFAVTLIRSFFPPEKTKKVLSHKREFIGNIIAALMGIITPFCSCSAVPVFIGFVEAGVPLGVTFSFLISSLISSPMVNEVALGMLWVMFGWKIALIYIASGLVVAIFGGIIIGRLKLEHLVEDYVYQIGASVSHGSEETCCSSEAVGGTDNLSCCETAGNENCCVVEQAVSFKDSNTCCSGNEGNTEPLRSTNQSCCCGQTETAEEVMDSALPKLTWKDRFQYARDYVVQILKRVWLYVVIGIAIGAFIHGYAPADFLVKYAGKGNLFAVPIAVAIGVPLYSNAAGTIPIVNALMEKGMPLGTVLAFMMSVTALSLPEMIILKQVLKPKLIAIFVAIIALAIMATGYFFNLIM